MSSAPTVGMAIPERQHYCDEVQQMLYNASLWNGHRIHFDMPYATEVEGYPWPGRGRPTDGRLASIKSSTSGSETRE
jgi:hypothetical protein